MTTFYWKHTGRFTNHQKYGQIYGISINLMADGLKLWVLNPDASFIFKFYFKDFNHFDKARMFCLTGGEGCVGIFKYKKYLNSTLLL